MTSQRIQKAAVLCGLGAVVAFLILYMIAMSLDSTYVFGKNYLSDLGVSKGAWAFNAALILTGFLLIPFSVLGLGPALGDTMWAVISKVMLVISALFLVSVGVFTEDAGVIHGIASYGFFLTMLVAFAFGALALYRTEYLGKSGYGFTLLVLIFGLILLPMSGDPLSETVAVLGIIVWGLVMECLLMLKMSGRSVP
ncbi:MAG: DUF998 domain-containing protein [Euryarchaeota archaeon]|nr:DUF998 domain-containing protein [Euryarchaeota archaeon]